MIASKDFVESCMAIIKATTEKDLEEAAKMINDNKELSEDQAGKLLGALKDRATHMSKEPDRLGVLEIVDGLF
jgi:hypothetical protein